MDLLDTQLYGLIGDDGFHRLTAAFFRRVPHDDLLAPMYQHDLAGAEWRLREFLVGRFGGPTRYIDQRGHPRLRMRHAPFKINTAARDRWIATFRHSGASFTRDGELFTDLRAAFDGGDEQRLVTVDHEIRVDGVNATQRCVAVLFAAMFGDTALRATGIFQDTLTYERGGWYFTSRTLQWDSVPSRHPLVM